MKTTLWLRTIVLTFACTAPETNGGASDVVPPADSAVAVPADSAPGDPISEPTEGGVDSPPWQAALARGVDFRALGQEPGWSLDVDREGLVVYAGDYGTDTLRAPVPSSVRAGDADAWSVRGHGRELHVRVVERDCRDAMSGERFTHTVTILIEGRELQGCGRWLRQQR